MTPASSVVVVCQAQREPAVLPGSLIRARKAAIFSVPYLVLRIRASGRSSVRPAPPRPAPPADPGQGHHRGGLGVGGHGLRRPEPRTRPPGLPHASPPPLAPAADPGAGLPSTEPPLSQ